MINKTYAIIGAGVSGLSIARMLREKGYAATVYEKESTPGGLIRCERVEGVLYHCVGGHVCFEEETIDTPNYQGCAVVNYTEKQVPYTRIIEHKHFEDFGEAIYAKPKTVISREYSTEWTPGSEPFYPVNDERNSALYAQYKALADKEANVIFGGRLAEYKYYDMAPVIEQALKYFC